MYSTCIRCYAPLGANETIETFPIGRRLAFDPAKGRLWVVCRKCERWNLTPLEERWEAIEDCERRFRGTTLRASTDNIGLARVGDGLDLVRIGRPLLPEMAAWRYGDQFGRRRLRYGLTAVGGVAAVGLFIVGQQYGLMAGGGMGAWQVFMQAHDFYNRRRVRARVRIPEMEDPVLVRLKQLSAATITDVGSDWVLHLRYQQPRSWTSKRLKDPEYGADLRGDDALRVAAQLLPAINAQGAGRKTVQSAVKLLEETPHTPQLFMRFAGKTTRTRTPSSRRLHEIREKRRKAEQEMEEDRGLPWRMGVLIGSQMHFVDSRPADPPYVQTEDHHQELAKLPAEARLALEMAVNEDSERRAMEGELAVLEMEWRDAEEIAQIADNELTPQGDAALTKLKGGTTGV